MTNGDDAHGVPAEASCGAGAAQARAADGAHAAHDAVRVLGDRRYLWTALLLLAAFLAAEVAVAIISGSLVLLSDAGHMLTDVGAIGAALWAMRLANRPETIRLTFGWKRAEILSAAANGVTLLVVSGVVTYEAIRRLITPAHVQGSPVLVMAIVGCVVNVGAGWALARANRSSLNIEGAYQHVLTDLAGFIGTAIAGVIILATGYERADPIASLVVVGLMLLAAYRLLRESGAVLLEATPEGLDLSVVRTHLMEVDHVHDVHDLHAWTITSGMPALSAHVVVDTSCFTDGHAPQLLDEIQACLAGHFDLEHSTFQLEPATHGAHERGAHR